jgi:glutamate synthase (NADPH/NADH) small chain
MGDPRGFLKVARLEEDERSVEERVQDWREIVLAGSQEQVSTQASRCMDCGIPYCHNGCPLGNLIPEWNELVYRGKVAEAATRLLATNNFPEVTGRVCPAPCEASCVLNMDGEPVTIKTIERTIADRQFEGGGPLTPHPPHVRTGKRVAVVGSGPAGMAAAQQLARAGHDVVLFERDDRFGGLLRYGIPDFKMEKGIIDKRIEQMSKEGVTFRAGVAVGTDLPGEKLSNDFDAVVLCLGSRLPQRSANPRASVARACTLPWSFSSSRIAASRATSCRDSTSDSGDRQAGRRHRRRRHRAQTASGPPCVRGRRA